jgi:hypothetical protein
LAKQFTAQVVQLSSEIKEAFSSTAPMRFSVSSILLEAVITGQNQPVVMVAITSTR